MQTNIVTDVHFELFGESGAIRMLVFTTCPETGARSILDILEVDNTARGIQTFSEMAADYTHRRGDTPAYTCKTSDGQPGLPAAMTLDECDTGKARLLTSKIRKMLEQL